MEYVAPVKSRRWGHWVWIVTRECENGHQTKINAGPTKLFGHHRGPSLPPGAIRCPRCESLVSFR